MMSKRKNKHLKSCLAYVLLIVIFLSSFLFNSFCLAASVCGSAPGYTNCVDGNNTYSGAYCSSTSTTAVCNAPHNRCRSLFASGMLTQCCCKETSCDDVCKNIMTAGFPSCNVVGDYLAGRDWLPLNMCNSFEDEKFFSPIACGAVGSFDSQNKCCCTKPNCMIGAGEGCAGYGADGQPTMNGSCPTTGGPFNIEGMCCCPIDCTTVCMGFTPGVPAPPSNTCSLGSFLSSMCCCTADCGNAAGQICDGFDQPGYLNFGTCLSGDYARGPNDVCCCKGMFSPSGDPACP